MRVMKNKILPIFFMTLLFPACNKEIKTVEWISTNPEMSWQSKRIQIVKGRQPDSTVIVFPEKTQQVIDGFGGCFNELGWVALNSLSSAESGKILADLFDTVSGCRLNLCRMPIGANDYSVDWYSHCPVKNDFEMKFFSLERDRLRLIPCIKEAQIFNPDLRLWASPWCPPEWMKTNNHYACRPDKVNDLSEAGRGEEMKTQFRMEPAYLKAYALYFSKFISEYRKEGIKISAVHVQNEMNSCQNFPSCIWSPDDLASFIGGYLGPRFAKDSLETEIWLGTIERPQIERIEPILNDPQAAKYIKGLGFQWAGKAAIPVVHEKHPGYKLMQTETECGDGSNDWKAAEHTFELMKHYFNNGANAYMYWNMVLNETGKSQWGWKQNSMITVDSNTKIVTYNPEFYLMKHFSSFVKPGAFKVETSDENCIAFKNDDSVVIVYYNPGTAKEKSFRVGDSIFKLVLSERSFNTFRIGL